jgi:integrase
MLAKLRHKEVKVRRPNSHLYKGEEKFNGSVTYSVVGVLDRAEVRHSLGTDEKGVAIRRVSKLERALAEGPDSLLWSELADSLPPRTYSFFAGKAGLGTRNPTLRATLQDLTNAYDIEMQRKVDNKLRGVSAEEGTLSESSRTRYRQSINHFVEFVGKETPLVSLDNSTITKFKLARYKAITQLKQARGGSSVALDIAILHGMFRFGISQGVLKKNLIDLSKESKPGKNPKNGARPFTAEELSKLRNGTIWKHKGQAPINDEFMFLLFRWTGLRRSDTIRLCWKHIQFDRGVNGEIEIVTQKRGKLAVIPLSTELRIALEHERTNRKPNPEDHVLVNPATGDPFSSATRLTNRCKALGDRAGVRRCTPHCFRDTFACDMLAKGAGIHDVAKMLADTVETVEEHYAQFIPASRDNIQAKMDSGVGIEEQAVLAAKRGKKVVGIR